MSENPYEAPRAGELPSPRSGIVGPIKRVLGGMLLVVGVPMAAWIGYNLVWPHPAARDAPIEAVAALWAGLIYVGVRWVLGRPIRLRSRRQGDGRQ